MLKGLNVQYVTDEEGNKKAVLIPFEDWAKFEKQLSELLETSQLKAQLKKALNEVTALINNPTKQTSLNDFLNEC